jgi:ATP-dependent DNA helicase RecQ
MKQPDSISWEPVKAALRSIWGYDDFRPPQGEIIQTLLTGKDALVVMPTGGENRFVFSFQHC